MQTIKVNTESQIADIEKDYKLHMQQGAKLLRTWLELNGIRGVALITVEVKTPKGSKKQITKI